MLPLYNNDDGVRTIKTITHHLHSTGSCLALGHLNKVEL